MSTTMSFEGRTAVISGGGRGLGRTYALEMARRGANIVVNDPGSSVTGTGTAAAAEEVRTRTAGVGGEIAFLDTVAFDAFLREDEVRWQKFVGALKAR